jgi:glutamyl-tRNA synthetase
MVLRNEDLDRARVRREFVAAFIEDLRWLGLDWDEGPDVGGSFGPYNQSERLTRYREAFDRLRRSGWLFPCKCSRKDVLNSLAAPHAGEEGPLYPGTCRTRGGNVGPTAKLSPLEPEIRNPEPGCCWRFRVPDGEAMSFVDRGLGPQSFVAGKDFGDFVVWRVDGLPSYQLAVVVDDAAMRISQVVRGADLLVSTARQLLLYRALGIEPPVFHHCPLMTDERGQRLAKRHDALSLRALRERGVRPQELIAGFDSALPGSRA